MAKTTLSRRRSTQRAPEINTFPQAVRFLLERTDFERMRVVRYDEDSFKLDRIRALLDEMGNPHEHVRFVHVAGTVGKGSTVAMIAAMLQGAGYAVGQFTSPHLVDVRERISINGSPISKTEFVDLVQLTADAASAADIEATYFEMLTAVGLKHFADQAVDIAVLETGLGGRLDSTNIITPEVSVITKIDLDHTQLLGESIEKVAREKAGILKQGVPAITCIQEDSAARALKEAAEEVRAPLRVLDQDIEFSFRFGATPELGPHIRVCVLTETSQFMHIPVPLPGEHQAVNCGLALAVIDMLKASGFEVPEVEMNDGLAQTNTPGRMELVWTSPRILVDGAHNPISVGALMRSVGAHIPYDSMVVIFGCCEDKNIPAMMDKLALGGDKVIFTKAKSNPRAMDPEDLQRAFSERCGKMSQVAHTLPEALDLASRAVSREDIICITGSFYLVGDVKKHLANIDRKR